MLFHITNLRLLFHLRLTSVKRNKNSVILILEIRLCYLLHYEQLSHKISYPLLLTFFILLVLSGDVLSQCDSDIRLFNQAQIDEFSKNYAGCEVYNDTITIDGQSPYAQITNLNGLHILKEIKGSLIIEVTELTSLKGLDSLKKVGNSFSLFDNKDLLSLTGVENLETIGDFCHIDGSNSLFSLQGLNNLNFIGGHLIISENQVLHELRALEDLVYIGESFELLNNPSLTTTNGIQNLTHVQYFSVQRNDKMAAITDLLKLKTLKNLGISDNDNIRHFSGLSNLQVVSNRLTIELNSSLETLGFWNLEKTGILVIENNNKLENLLSLESLTEITEGPLRLAGLPTLKNLDGLNNLQIINSSKTPTTAQTTITFNSSLENIDSLFNLTKIHQPVLTPYKLESLYAIWFIDSGLESNVNSNSLFQIISTPFADK